MQRIRAGMVDIVRDFLGVHRLLRSMALRYADGALEFDDVEQFVGDDASSVLFRLKESCHAIFRPSGGDAEFEVGAGALLDLVLGSLFHEAMALRENLYQLESYGARVQALKARADVETAELLQEFEKILAASAKRLDEAVIQIDALLGQARRQFFHLLVEYRDDGLLTRCLWEQADLVSSAFGQDVEELFTEIYGESTSALVLAADSYLESAYYGEALSVLREASARAVGRQEIQERIHFANGMSSFMLRDYPASISELTQWWRASRSTCEKGRVKLALQAIVHVQGTLPAEGLDGLDADELQDLAAELESAAG
ncbi:MAG: hypothetical protein VCC04_15050 [Myxococcota bacterium]